MSTEAEPLSTVEIAEIAEQAVRSAEPAGKSRDSRPSILFCCPGSVLDITSGAALSLRSILAAAGAAPTPRPAGNALVLTLPAVPTRPLSDYAIATLTSGEPS